MSTGGGATTRGWGLGVALLSAACFGASGPFGKALIGAGLDPVQAVWLRVTGAAVVLVPIVLLFRGRRGLQVVGRRWPWFLLYGLTGVAGCQAFYFVAAERLPVGVAILLEFTGPVLVVGWVRLVRRVSVPRSAAVGVVTALVGLACVVQVWSGLRLDAVGLLAGLGAAACQAAFFLLVERLSEDADPVVTTAVGTVVAAVVLGGLATPWSLPWDVLTASVPMGTHHLPGWVLVAWIVVVSTVLAYLAGVTAVRRLSAPVAGGVAYVEAVAAAVIAWVALGEKLSAAQITGGVIVLVGAFVAQRAVAEPETITDQSVTPVLTGTR